MLKYIENARRLGRPKKATLEAIQKVVDIITKDTKGRHLTCNRVAKWLDSDISRRTVNKIFKQQGFK